VRLPRSPIAPQVRLERPSGRPLPLVLRAFRGSFNRGPEAMQDFARRAASKTIVERVPELVARYPDGRVFHAPAGDRMYAQVFILGEYEPEVSAAMRRLLRAGDLAVDVGANHGWYSVLMGNAVGPAGRVWAVEPLPPLLAELRRNVGSNPSLPIEVKEIALGAEDGELEVHLFEGLPHGHASASTLGRDDYESFKAPMKTLDGIAGDERPALIKIDVEGGEREVLRGAQRLLAADAAPIVMLEVNHETSAAFGYEPRELIDLLPGYEVWRAEHGGLERETEPASAPHGATWVCVPPGRRDRLS